MSELSELSECCRSAVGLCCRTVVPGLNLLDIELAGSRTCGIWNLRDIEPAGYRTCGIWNLWDINYDAAGEEVRRIRHLTAPQGSRASERVREQLSSFREANLAHRGLGRRVRGSKSRNGKDTRRGHPKA